MEYISSDTNVWLDFVEIEKLNLPFQLPYIYIMNDETIEDELLNPPGISDKLLQLGLQKTELTEEEFYLAGTLASRYAKPSIYDCIALAIAKIRGLTLLTGDGPLRKAAVADVLFHHSCQSIFECILNILHLLCSFQHTADQESLSFLQLLLPLPLLLF